MTSFFDYFWSGPADEMARRPSEQPLSPPVDPAIRQWTEPTPKKRRELPVPVFYEVRRFQFLGLDIKRGL